MMAHRVVDEAMSWLPPIGLAIGMAIGFAWSDDAPSKRVTAPTRCVSWLFATLADTALYETHCVGGVRPDSVANPPESNR